MMCERWYGWKEAAAEAEEAWDRESKTRTPHKVVGKY